MSECLDTRICRFRAKIVENDEKCVNSRNHTLKYCLATSVSSWNTFPNARYGQQYLIYWLGLLKITLAT